MSRSHKDNKPSKRHSRHSSGGHSKGSSSSARHEEPRRPILSFLFMVNELRFDVPDRDDYSHSVPPTIPQRYTHEIPSAVMLYNGGNVTQQPGYIWDRAEPHSEGLLWATSPDGESYTVTQYSQFAVFACNPHLPIMICPSDPYANVTNASWQLLQIHHPRAMPGLSQVAHEDSPMPEGPGLGRYVAGGDPAWIPSLLPETYRWRLPNAPPASTGLGGELPIILGLMALTADQDGTNQNNNTNVVFAGDQSHRGRWRNNHWYSNGDPRGHPPTSEDYPRGFLVTVFLDPNNPEGSNAQWLRYFEWQQAIVTEA